MTHDIPLITTIAAGFGLALILGLLAEKLRLPALVGYLLAGILIGPATPGFVADADAAAQLSEIGVMLLMFGVGLHFSLADLLAVRGIALPGALVQMGVATLLGLGMAWAWWGWAAGVGLVFGLSLACASTVVLLRALESRGALTTMNGRIAVGWLVMEDLATVLILVLLPPLAGLLGGTTPAHADRPLWLTLGLTLLEVGAFIALMLIVGRRALPRLLSHVAGTGSRELFTLATVAAAITIAWGAAALFSVSFALGAFFAGMMMRESEFSHRAASETLPLRDAFSVLFFVAVGMLFDPAILVQQPLQVLGVVAIVVVGKAVAALLLVLALGYPLTTALLVAASLAQIGEFSFILAGLGVSLGLLSAEGMNLVLAGALISIALNPLLFALVQPLGDRLLRHSRLARHLETRLAPTALLPMDTEDRYLSGQVVLVGHGRVGQRLANELARHDIPCVVVEQNRERVEALRQAGAAAVSGDATDALVLVQAHVADAAMLVIATGDPVDVRQIATTARTLNPGLEIVVRSHYEADTALLRAEGIATVFLDRETLADGMTRHILQRFRAADGAPPAPDP